MSAVVATEGLRYGSTHPIYGTYICKTNRWGYSFDKHEQEAWFVVSPLLAGKPYGRIQKLLLNEFGYSPTTAWRRILGMKGEYNPRQPMKRWRHVFPRVLSEALRRLGPSLFLRYVEGPSSHTPPRNEKLQQTSGSDGPSGPERGPPDPVEGGWDGTQAVPAIVTHQLRSSWDGVGS